MEENVILEKDQEQQAWLACGLLLTQRFNLAWLPLVGGQWSWDRQGCALHCKTLLSSCESPSLTEGMVALGKYAQNTVECELTACSTDRQCVPLLQEAWRQTVGSLHQNRLEQTLEPVLTRKSAALRM